MGGVVGIAMVRDEEDIVFQSVTRMLDQVERVIVADNGSSDGTRDILEALGASAEYGERLQLVDDPELGYYQSRKMSVLAATAGQQGAAWVVPFDADEVWYSPHGRISEVLGEHPEASIATAEVYDHVASAADGDGNPVERMRHRRVEPCPLRKVACRPYPRVTIEQGNHGADYGHRVDELLVVRHFPYRSPEQFERKVRNGAEAYAATTLPEDQGRHWREYGRLLESGGPEVLHDVFRAWFWSADPARDGTLIEDPCP